jgi:hypothetical protein
VAVDAVAFSSADAWLWTRRILLGALTTGVAATMFILGHMGAGRYGLPTLLLRRVPCAPPKRPSLAAAASPSH